MYKLFYKNIFKKSILKTKKCICKLKLYFMSCTYGSLYMYIFLSTSSLCEWHHIDGFSTKLWAKQFYEGF